jgi:murein DD-endopeptidase
MPFSLLFLLLAPAPDARAPMAEVRPYHSLDLTIPHAPPVARIDGEDRLVYELHATNFSSQTLTVSDIELRTAEGESIARLAPDGIMRRIGERAGNAHDLAAGQRAIFYLSIPWGDRGAAPLIHRIALLPKGAGRPVAIEGGAFQPQPATGIALGAPLRGGPWTAVQLPEAENGHRRYPYAVSGRVRLPGRHAIDWMPAAGFDRASAGADVAADGSGADVLAVADGEILVVKDASAPGARASVEDETGTMIVQQLPGGRFAFYQHLMPGIPVRQGERVRNGQVIGRVGSTGHVTQPHLHFHVSDGIAPLDSEGLPYRLAAGRVIGDYADRQDFRDGKPWRNETERPVDGLPAPYAVIRFGP